MSVKREAWQAAIAAAAAANEGMVWSWAPDRAPCDAHGALTERRVDGRPYCVRCVIDARTVAPAPLRVWDLESDGAPVDIGAYVRSEEDAIVYRRADGSEGMAPADCVAVRDTAPGVALARAYVDAYRAAEGGGSSV